jgi:hypothetical protein
MSGCGTTPDPLQQALALGAVGALRKPFSVAVVLEAIGAALGDRSGSP